jgi:hypothetical protein
VALLLVVGVTLAGCKDSTGPQNDACDSFQTLTVGVTTVGSLSTSDCVRALDGSYADRYRFTLPAAANVQIDLASTQFDAWLVLGATSGDPIASDDDSGDGENARLFAMLAAGTYEVLANSFAPGETGTYQLLVAVIAE